MSKQEKYTWPKLVCEAIEKYLLDTMEGGSEVLDWKKVSGLIPAHAKGKEDISAEQCKLVWGQLTGESSSQSGKKRKASSDPEEDSYAAAHLVLGTLEEKAGKVSGQDDDKGEGDVTGVHGIQIFEPPQFHLPRSHDSMSFTSFKRIPHGSAQLSMSGARLLGASYAAALCSSKHARLFLNSKSSNHVKAPSEAKRAYNKNKDHR